MYWSAIYISFVSWYSKQSQHNALPRWPNIEPEFIWSPVIAGWLQPDVAPCLHSNNLSVLGRDESWVAEDEREETVSTLDGMVARKLCASDLKCPLIIQIVPNACDILIYIIHIVFSMFIVCDISIYLVH